MLWKPHSCPTNSAPLFSFHLQERGSESILPKQSQSMTEDSRFVGHENNWISLSLALKLIFFCISDPADSKARSFVVATVYLSHWQREGKVNSLAFYVGGIVELFVTLLLKIKKGPMKGQLLEVIKRKIPIDRLTACSLRYDTSREFSAVIVTAALCSFISLLCICRY